MYSDEENVNCVDVRLVVLVRMYYITNISVFNIINDNVT